MQVAVQWILKLANVLISLHRRAFFVCLVSSLSCSIVAINGRTNRQENGISESLQWKMTERCGWMEKWFKKNLCSYDIMWVDWMPIRCLIRIDGLNCRICALVWVWILISVNRLITDRDQGHVALWLCVDFITRHIWLHTCNYRLD